MNTLELAKKLVNMVIDTIIDEPAESVLESIQVELVGFKRKVIEDCAVKVENGIDAGDCECDLNSGDDIACEAHSMAYEIADKVRRAK